MKMLVMALALALAATPALARKSCEELKTEIAQKIQGKGVKAFTLDVVGKDDKAEGKVVGTCDGGEKKIVYTRGEAPATAEKK